MNTLAVKERSRKKTLGQFFTGERVGRLLAALAGASAARTIIDPMVGTGDLLTSCLAVGAAPTRLVGVDLDHLAVAQARSALAGVAGAELFCDDAFSMALPEEQFDLVITNPPYIRYQSRDENHDVTPPSASAVREGLIRAVEARAHLDGAARSMMLEAARNYPSTADIAVPAWILSAALVREGGMLAVVAPQTWMSRNYAHHVRELLGQAFDVEFIVEDGDVSWFDDALVRTHLVVARRRPVGGDVSSSPTIVGRATRELNRDGILAGDFVSERELVEALRATTSLTPSAVTRGLQARREAAAGVVSSPSVSAQRPIPARVVGEFGSGIHRAATKSLASYGWEVGQGLRTGANEFFYVETGEGLAVPADRWGAAPLPVPASCMLPVVRRQSDVRQQADVRDPEALPSRLLYLQGWATTEDIGRMRNAAEMQRLPQAVCRWIEQVASAPLLPSRPTRLFPELTAVAPNARTDSDGYPVSFWYQLPPLAKRHRPEIFLPRVCGGRPTAVANSGAAVVDANFATLWRNSSDALSSDALLALLHSDWVAVMLEYSCTVLGGGALKVEATDLRRLPLPELPAQSFGALAELGRQLREGATDHVQDRIDGVVATAVSTLAGVEAMQTQAVLRTMTISALRERSR